MILFSALLAFSSGFAQDNGQQWAGNLEMNGYKISDYQNFASEYTLVTVRYRQDSGEFRFTYANSIALKALKENKPYPDNAVFAKTAYLLSPDRAFPSSLTPNKVNRYQLMVKNAAKHKDTDGWGYALFDSTGRTFAGEPKAAAMACRACHQIVKDKNYVFSDLIFKGVNFFSDAKANQAVKKKNKYLPEFETVAVKKLPKFVADLIPKSAKSVRSIKGNLKKYIFEGTLNEIRPFLGSEVLASQLPALLISEDGKQFSLVYSDVSAGENCVSASGKATSMVAIISVPKTTPVAPYAEPGRVEGETASSSFCFVNQ